MSLGTGTHGMMERESVVGSSPIGGANAKNNGVKTMHSGALEQAKGLTSQASFGSSSAGGNSARSANGLQRRSRAFQKIQQSAMQVLCVVDSFESVTPADHTLLHLKYLNEPCLSLDKEIGVRVVSITFFDGTIAFSQSKQALNAVLGVSTRLCFVYKRYHVLVLVDAGESMYTVCLSPTLESREAVFSVPFDQVFPVLSVLLDALSLPLSIPISGVTLGCSVFFSLLVRCNGRTIQAVKKSLIERNAISRIFSEVKQGLQAVDSLRMNCSEIEKKKGCVGCELSSNPERNDCKKKLFKDKSLDDEMEDGDFPHPCFFADFVCDACIALRYADSGACPSVVILTDGYLPNPKPPCGDESEKENASLVSFRQWKVPLFFVHLSTQPHAGNFSSLPNVTNMYFSSSVSGGALFDVNFIRELSAEVEPYAKFCESSRASRTRDDTTAIARKGGRNRKKLRSKIMALSYLNRADGFAEPFAVPPSSFPAALRFVVAMLCRFCQMEDEHNVFRSVSKQIVRRSLPFGSGSSFSSAWHTSNTAETASGLEGYPSNLENSKLPADEIGRHGSDLIADGCSPFYSSLFDQIAVEPRVKKDFLARSLLAVDRVFPWDGRPPPAPVSVYQLLEYRLTLNPANVVVCRIKDGFELRQLLFDTHSSCFRFSLPFAPHVTVNYILKGARFSGSNTSKGLVMLSIRLICTPSFYQHFIEPSNGDLSSCGDMDSLLAKRKLHQLINSIAESDRVLSHVDRFVSHAVDAVEPEVEQERLSVALFAVFSSESLPRWRKWFHVESYDLLFHSAVIEESFGQTVFSNWMDYISVKDDQGFMHAIKILSPQYLSDVSKSLRESEKVQAQKSLTFGGLRQSSIYSSRFRGQSTIADRILLFDDPAFVLIRWCKISSSFSSVHFGFFPAASNHTREAIMNDFATKLTENLPKDRFAFVCWREKNLFELGKLFSKIPQPVLNRNQFGLTCSSETLSAFLCEKHWHWSTPGAEASYFVLQALVRTRMREGFFLANSSFSRKDFERSFSCADVDKRSSRSSGTAYLLKIITSDAAKTAKDYSGSRLLQYRVSFQSGDLLIEIYMERSTFSSKKFKVKTSELNDDELKTMLRNHIFRTDSNVISTSITFWRIQCMSARSIQSTPSEKAYVVEDIPDSDDRDGHEKVSATRTIKVANGVDSFVRFACCNHFESLSLFRSRCSLKSSANDAFLDRFCGSLSEQTDACLSEGSSIYGCTDSEVNRGQSLPELEEKVRGGNSMKSKFFAKSLDKSTILVLRLESEPVSKCQADLSFNSLDEKTGNFEYADVHKVDDTSKVCLPVDTSDDIWNANQLNIEYFIVDCRRWMVPSAIVDKECQWLLNYRSVETMDESSEGCNLSVLETAPAFLKKVRDCYLFDMIVTLHRIFASSLYVKDMIDRVHPADVESLLSECPSHSVLVDASRLREIVYSSATGDTESSGVSPNSLDSGFSAILAKFFFPVHGTPFFYLNSVNGLRVVSEVSSDVYIDDDEEETDDNPAQDDSDVMLKNERESQTRKKPEGLVVEPIAFIRDVRDALMIHYAKENRHELDMKVAYCLPPIFLRVAVEQSIDENAEMEHQDVKTQSTIVVDGNISKFILNSNEHLGKSRIVLKLAFFELPKKPFDFNRVDFKYLGSDEARVPDGMDDLLRLVSEIQSEYFLTGVVDFWTKAITRYFRANVRGIISMAVLKALQAVYPITEETITHVRMLFDHGSLPPDAISSVTINLDFINRDLGIRIFEEELIRTELINLRRVGSSTYFVVQPINKRRASEPNDESVLSGSKDGWQSENLPVSREYTIPYWAIFIIRGDIVTLEFCHAYPSRSFVAHYLLDYVRNGILKTVDRANQMILLLQLHETRLASPLLIEPDSPFLKSGVEATIPDGYSDSSKNTPAHGKRKSAFVVKTGLSHNTKDLEPRASVNTELHESKQSVASKHASLTQSRSKLACPCHFRQSFSINKRLRLSAAMLELSENALHPFAVSNRRNTFVYRESTGQVFYLRLRQQAGRIDDVEDKVVLEVYGIHSPPTEMKEMLCELLSSRIANYTLATLSRLLHRNPQFRIQPYDLKFVRGDPELGGPVMPQNSLLLRLPRFVEDLQSFLMIFRQNLLMFMQQLHLAFDLATEEGHENEKNDNDTFVTLDGRPVFDQEDFLFFYSSTAVNVKPVKGSSSVDVGVGIAISMVNLLDADGESVERIPDLVDKADGSSSSEDDASEAPSVAIDSEDQVLSSRRLARTFLKSKFSVRDSPIDSLTDESPGRYQLSIDSWQSGQIDLEMLLGMHMDAYVHSMQEYVFENFDSRKPIFCTVDDGEASRVRIKKSNIFALSKEFPRFYDSIGSTRSSLFRTRRRNTGRLSPLFLNHSVSIDSCMYFPYRVQLLQLLSRLVACFQPDLCQLTGTEEQDSLNLLKIFEAQKSGVASAEGKENLSAESQPFLLHLVCAKQFDLILPAVGKFMDEGFDMSSAESFLEGISDATLYRIDSTKDGFSRVVRLSKEKTSFDPRNRCRPYRTTQSHQQPVALSSDIVDDGLDSNHLDGLPADRKRCCGKRQAYAAISIDLNNVCVWLYNWSAHSSSSFFRLLELCTNWFCIRVRLLLNVYYQRMGIYSRTLSSSAVSFLLDLMQWWKHQNSNVSSDRLTITDLLLVINSMFPPEKLMREIVGTDASHTVSRKPPEVSTSVGIKERSTLAVAKAAMATRQRGLRRHNTAGQASSSRNFSAAMPNASFVSGVTAANFISGNSSVFRDAASVFATFNLRFPIRFDSALRLPQKPKGNEDVTRQASLSEDTSAYDRMMPEPSASWTGAISTRQVSEQHVQASGGNENVLEKFESMLIGKTLHVTARGSTFNHLKDPVVRFCRHVAEEAQVRRMKSEERHMIQRVVGRWRKEWAEQSVSNLLFPVSRQMHSESTEACSCSRSEIDSLMRASRVLRTVVAPLALAEHEGVSFADSSADIQSRTFRHGVHYGLLQAYLKYLVNDVGMREIVVSESLDVSVLQDDGRHHDTADTTWPVSNDREAFAQKLFDGAVAIMHAKVSDSSAAVRSISCTLRFIESDRGTEVDGVSDDSETVYSAPEEFFKRSSMIATQGGKFGHSSAGLAKLRSSINLTSVVYDFHIFKYRQMLKKYSEGRFSIARQIFGFADRFPSPPNGAFCGLVKHSFQLLIGQTSFPVESRDVFRFVVESAEKYGISGLKPTDSSGEWYLLLDGIYPQLISETNISLNPSDSSAVGFSAIARERHADQQSESLGSGSNCLFLDVCLIMVTESTMLSFFVDENNSQGMENMSENSKSKIKPSKRKDSSAAKEKYFVGNIISSPCTIDESVNAVDAFLRRMFSRALLDFQRMHFWGTLQQLSSDPMNQRFQRLESISISELFQLSFRCELTDIDPSLSSLQIGVKPNLRDLAVFLRSVYGPLALRSIENPDDDIVILPCSSLGFGCVIHFSASDSPPSDAPGINVCFPRLNLSNRVVDDCEIFLTGFVMNLQSWLWMELDT